jgi:hypothetical protein
MQIADKEVNTLSLALHGNIWRRINCMQTLREESGSSHETAHSCTTQLAINPTPGSLTFDNGLTRLPATTTPGSMNIFRFSLSIGHEH